MKKFCIVGVVVSFLILVSIPISFGLSNNDTNLTKATGIEINDSEAISTFEKTVGAAKTDVERKNIIKAFYMIRPSLKDTEIGKNLSSTINETTEQQSGQIEFEDGTPYIIDLLQVAASLDNGTQSNIQSMVSVIPSALNNITSTNHFDIHYTLDPASPDNTTIDFVNELADDLENKTYQTEVTEWGYKEGSSGVLSSKYQVYINYIDCSPNCIKFGVTKPTPLLDGTYIQINNQISGYNDGLKLGTAAHEYHHASQNSYDSFFTRLTDPWAKRWVYEGSAAWMEHEVFRKYYPNDVIDYDFGLFRDRMNEYLSTPYKDIADEREDWGYPSGQYWYFLADNSKINFNGSGMQRIVNRKVWENLNSHTWLNVNGVIDDALADAPSGYNSFNESFKPFTRANYFNSWYPSEINYIGNVNPIPIDLTMAPYEVTKKSGDVGIYPVDHYGAEYFKITAPDSANVSITFKAKDSGANFYVRVYSGGIENNEIEIPLSDGNGSITTKATNIVVIVGRLNDGGLLGTPSGNFTIHAEANGLHASYYNDPIYRTNINAIATPTVGRIDPNINFDWHSFGRNDPVPAGISDDGWWSADWTGFIYAPVDGTYYFRLNSDDGSWLFIDGQLVVNNGGDHAPQDAYGSVALTKGYYSIMVKYFESLAGEANINLYWKPPNESGYTIIPSNVLFLSPPEGSLSNMYLSKSAPASMDHGNTMTYTLYFNNFGGMAASNAVLQDTLPSNVEFVSASDSGTYDSVTRNVTWSLGSVAAFPSGRGIRTVTVRIPSSVTVGTVIQNTASISTSTLETRYNDNSASASTIVTGSNLPPDVGISPTNGNTGGTTSVYWGTPVTFTYYSSCATNVGINVHVNDGGSDITGSMQETSPDTWTYTIRFYPRHGAATVTYTLSGCSTPSVAFNIYIDPAGYIYDANTGARISGATVWLQRPDGFGDWENVPTGQTPPISQPDVNPLTTGADGQYQWDVLEGSYRVHVEAPGYYPADSIVVSVPPPVTDLHIGLTHLPDAIPPITTAILHGSQGNNGWYISDVQVDLTATDNDGGSGVNKIDFSFDGINWNTYSVPLTIANEGATTVYYRSVDNAGNVETTKTQGINIDKTPPIITGAPTTSPNANSWYNNTVVINFTASDNISGVDTVTPDTAISTEGASQSIVGTATDRAGNSNNTNVSGINIDKTPPQIVIYTPANESVYILNQTLTANWSAYDSLSGIASATGTVPNGLTIDTGIVGAKTFNVVAADNASNSADQNAFYIIAYNYLGILPPIKADNSSIFKSGSTVPVKFRIVDANGNNVSTAIANLTYQKITDDILGTVEEPFSTSAADNGNTFRYDDTDNLYIFNLGTSGMDKGTYQLNINLDDGTVHTVRISIKL